MRTLSKLALLAMLATGVSGVALVAPVAAQKPAPAAGGAPAFKLSKPVLAIAAQAQAAVQANNFAVAEPLIVQIETAATTDDDKYIAAALRFDLENHRLQAAQAANPKAPQDQRVLAKPLDALIAARNTPAAARAGYLFKRGQIAALGGQSAVAADYFTRARQAGYDPSEVDLQIVRTKVDAGDVAGGLGELETMVSARETAGQKPPESYYRYAIAQANQRKLNALTLTWLRKYAAAYPTSKVWYGVTMTYGIQQASVIKPNKVQLIDLYRLMRATGALADQALYEQYAQRAYDSGNPYEAQAVLKEGVASGKLQATAAFVKGLQTASATAIRNEGSLASTERQAAASATGDLAAQTGDVYLGQDNFAKAAELYRAALAKPAGKVSRDDINTHLGIALARTGDKAGAAGAFAAVAAPDSAGVAGLWATYVQAGVQPGTAAAG